MSIVKSIEVDEEYVKNMPSDLLSELIVLNDVIPQHLQNWIRNSNMVFHKERKKFIHGLERDNPILLEMNRRRGESNKLFADERIQKDFEYDLEFLEKYPQFKPVVKHVNLIDTDKVKIIGNEPLP